MLWVVVEHVHMLCLVLLRLKDINMGRNWISNPII